MCTPVVVSTTHPGLPSPPTIDWPPIPPAYWPSATFWPTSHRFLLISHPIRSVWVWQTPHWTPSTCLHSMHSSIHLSIHPSIHLSGPILSGLHALLCPSVPSSVHCHHWVTFTSVKRHCIYSKKIYFFLDTSATYLPSLQGLGPKWGIGISYGYPPHTLYYTLGHPLPANGTINPAPHHTFL